MRQLSIVTAFVASAAVAQTSQPSVPPRASIEVHNAAPVAWSGIVPVSIPWPEGAHTELDRVAIAGRVAPCEPFLRWPDGSIAVVRAWPRLRLAAASRTTLSVRALDGEFEPGPDEGTWWFDGDLPLHTVLIDPWGERFTAELVPDDSRGARGLVRAASRRRVQCFRSPHVRGDARNLGLRAYLKSWRGERRAVLTLLLDNDPRDGEPALGPVRFREFRLCTTDARLRVLPRFRHDDALPPPEPNEHGGFDQLLLVSSDQHYLGDRTAKAFRFDLFLDGDDVDDEERARATLPLPVALPACAWVRHTRAFGAHGGPAPSDTEPATRVRELIARHRSSAGHGPWSDRGDPAFAATQGTRRNQPIPLRDVLRCQSPELLRIGEARFLQHTLRPTPGFEPRRPSETRDHRRGMSTRVVEMPHGYSRLDYEHFSVDLVYDYYWLTADPLARDELARMGTGLVRVLDGVPFETSRGEGWCAQAAVLIARATDDPSIVAFVHDRFVTAVLPDMGKGDESFAIRQPPHEHAFGVEGDPFDAPWQMAALVHGLKALYEATRDVRLARAAVRTARTIATRGWIEEVGPKYLVSANDALRYRMPVGFGPFEGTAPMHSGALVLATELLEVTESEADRSLLTSRADFLFEGFVKSADAARDPWFQIYVDRHH